jgi:hypothetical protein
LPLNSGVVIVENQIAEGYEPTVRAIVRLTAGGLDRHEAVHAIGSIISAGIERITAKAWREKFK